LFVLDDQLYLLCRGSRPCIYFIRRGEEEKGKKKKKGKKRRRENEPLTFARRFGYLCLPLSQDPADYHDKGGRLEERKKQRKKRKEKRKRGGA